MPNLSIKSNCSPTFRNGIRLDACNINPNSSKRSSVFLFSFRLVISSPQNVISPLVASCKFPRIVKKVVLPEPEGPIMATNSPSLR